MRLSVFCRSAAYFCLSCTLALADTSAPEPGIGLNEAITRTLEHNPDLIAFGYQMTVQDARILQAGLRPNPQLDVAVENALGTGALSGLDGAEVTLSLTWLLEHEKRQRRLDTSRASASLVNVETKIRRLDAAAQTARQFLDCMARQAQLALSAEALALAEQTVTTAQARVDAGRTPLAELARAQAQLAHLQLAQEDAEHELQVSYHRLSAQWGQTQPRFKRTIGDINTLPAPISFQDLVAGLDDNPNLARFLTEYRLREAQLHQAQAQTKPNWRLTAGLRHLQGLDDQALMAGLTIPLAVRNRNQGGIAEAQAKLAMTKANRRASRVLFETELFALHQALMHSLHRAASIRDHILPRLEQALTETQDAYQAGRYSYLELRAVQAELLAARAALTDASINAHRNLIEIEHLTGTTLQSLAPQP